MQSLSTDLGFETTEKCIEWLAQMEADVSYTDGTKSVIDCTKSLQENWKSFSNFKLYMQIYSKLYMITLKFIEIFYAAYAYLQNFQIKLKIENTFAFFIHAFVLFPIKRKKFPSTIKRSEKQFSCSAIVKISEHTMLNQRLKTYQYDGNFILKSNRCLGKFINFCVGQI